MNEQGQPDKPNEQPQKAGTPMSTGEQAQKAAPNDDAAKATKACAPPKDSSWIILLFQWLKQFSKMDKQRFIKDFNELHTGERVMATITLAGILIAAYTIRVFTMQLEVMSQQLEEMRSGSAQTSQIIINAINLTAATNHLADRAKEQVSAVNTQAGATNRLARDARRQADIADRSLEAEERPWVGFDHVHISDKVAIGSVVSNSLVLRNWGRGPALHLTTQYQMHPFCSPFPIHPSYTTKGEIPPIALMPGQPTETGDTHFDKPLTDEAIKAFKDTNCNLYVYARIIYRDSARNEHWRHFCGVWAKESDNNFLTCSTYNDGDEDYKDGKEPQ
jgi:hypothetical protein